MKIILFIPWFGPIPNYFPVWVRSIKHLENIIDFLLITDCEDVEITIRPHNLVIRHMTFHELQERFASKLGVKLPHAYKLCDYKPIYHYLFSEYLSDKYEFWGYCDIDTVFGDVEKFLNDIDYHQYDRVGKFGHFTLYRNDNSIKDIYKTIIPGDHDPYHRFSYIQETSYPCHFDEEGMNHICEHLGLKFYQKTFHFNTIEKNYHIHTLPNPQDCELLTWEDGHTFRYHLLQNGIIEKEEQMYTHFQYQKDMPQINDIGDSFFLSPQGFRHFNPSELMDYLLEYGRIDNQEEKSKITNQYKVQLRHNRKTKLLREFRCFGWGGSKDAVVSKSKTLRCDI